MILIVTSSSQAFAKIQHVMMDRLRMSVTDESFVRVYDSNDALNLINLEESCFNLVIVAESTYERAEEFETALRLTHPTMPLIVVHRADRISSLKRAHTKDLSFPLQSYRMAEALNELLSSEHMERIKPSVVSNDVSRSFQVNYAAV